MTYESNLVCGLFLFINKVLLEHRHTHPFAYLPLCYKDRIEKLKQSLHSPQNIQYLFFGSSSKSSLEVMEFAMKYYSSEVCLTSFHAGNVNTTHLLSAFSPTILILGSLDSR